VTKDPKNPVFCERCGKELDPDKATWFEMNCRTLELAEPGTAEWSGGPDSQGCFAFGPACTKFVLTNPIWEPIY